MVYHFLEFRFDEASHKFYKDDKEVYLSQKEWLLLKLFIENPQTIINKDQLCEFIWQGRYVSDDSIYKQIQRLRKKIISAQSEDSIIRTVHGVGFEFNTKVKHDNKTEKKSDAQNAAKHSIRKNLFIIGSAITLIVIGMIIKKYNTPIPIIQDAEASPLRLAFVPKFNPQEPSDSLISVGSMYYLIHQLANNKKIKTVSIKRKKLKENTAEKNILILQKNNQIDASIVFDLQETDNGEYISNTELINKGNTSIKHTFRAVSLKNLMDQIEQWSSQQLNIISDSPKNQISQSHYAIENYIRAMAAQFRGDIPIAISFLELAIEEDPNFWLAWYELAISHRLEGDYQKSLSIINTLENTVTDKQISLMLLNAKIIALWRLGKLESALELSKSAIKLAQERNDLNIQSNLLVNQAIINNTLGNLSAAQQAIDQATTIREQLNADKGDMAYIYNTSAGIHLASGDLEKAESLAKKAIDGFQFSGHKKYVGNTQGRLASIYTHMGNYKQAREMILRNLSVRTNQNNFLGQIQSLLKLQSIDRLQGHLNDAKEKLEKISALLETNNDYALYNKYHRAQMKLSLALNDHITANAHIEQIQPRNNLEEAFKILALLDYYYHTKQLELMGPQIKLLSAYTQPKIQPLKTLWMARHAHLMKQNTVAEQLYTRAIEQAKKINHHGNITKAYNAYIKYLLSTSQLDKALPVIRDHEKHKPLPYPFYLLKAQYHAMKNDFFRAVSLMNELKIKSHQLWTETEEKKLSEYQHKLNQSSIQNNQ